MAPKPGKIFVVSAPSGAGKNTLLNHLHANVPDCVYSISATTRPPRPGEKNGVHYFFLDRDQFLRKVKNNEFAEWQEVHGNLYGTPRSFVESTIANGKHIIMDIDVYGKVTFDRVFPDSIGVLITVPSFEVLRERLFQRGSDSRETIALRLENARKELEFAQEKGRYAYTVVNDDLSRAQEEIVAIARREIERQ